MTAPQTETQTPKHKNNFMAEVKKVIEHFIINP